MSDVDALIRLACLLRMSSETVDHLTGQGLSPRAMPRLKSAAQMVKAAADEITTLAAQIMPQNKSAKD